MANRTGKEHPFVVSGHFKDCNMFLESFGKTSINW